jgi:hypothetical protein
MTNLYKNEHCNAVIFLKDGTSIEVSTDQIHAKKLHHWKDWYCYVGVDSIFVHDDFSVYAGMCKNDYLGNLFDKNFSLFTTPKKCKQDECTSCTADLFSTKFKEIINEH